MAQYYEAPITLGFTPADGDLIGGTVNGVEVNGQWIGKSRSAILYREGNTSVPFCMIGFRSEKAVISLRQNSAPTTDYELHLYRYVPASIVKIPKEYVEGLEMLPKDGNPGDVLVKTETGSEWQKQEPATSTPDWNQNDPTAKDYIKNRPGGYIKNHTLEWDGNTDGLESIEGMVFKISSEVFELSKNTVKSIEMTDGEKDVSTAEFVSQGPITQCSIQNQPVVVVVTKDAILGGNTLSKGTYFFSHDGNYVTKLVTTIKIKIEKEYISKPDDVVGGYLFDVIAEKNAMLSAIDEFREGKAIIMWHNELLLDATYYSDEYGKTSIYISEIDGHVKKYEEDESGTVYNKTLGKSVDYVSLISTDRIEDGAITKDKIQDGVLPSESKLLPSVTASDSGKFLRVSESGVWTAEEGMIINSSTPNSTKKFKITVDDAGTISATEVT